MDWSHFISCSGTTDLVVSRVRTRAGRTRFLTGKYGILSLAISPDGKTLASGAAGTSPECDVKLWNLDTGNANGVLKGHTHQVYALAFSSDRKTLAAGGYGAFLRRWDLSTNRELSRFRDSPKEIVHAIAFSHDGKTLAEGIQGRIRLLNVPE